MISSTILDSEATNIYTKNVMWYTLCIFLMNSEYIFCLFRSFDKN
jgi:hypothetical protein